VEDSKIEGSSQSREPFEVLIFLSPQKSGQKSRQKSRQKCEHFEYCIAKWTSSRRLWPQFHASQEREEMSPTPVLRSTCVTPFSIRSVKGIPKSLFAPSVAGSSLVSRSALVELPPIPSLPVECPTQRRGRNRPAFAFHHGNHFHRFHLNQIHD
jgi:hypothetical protein